MAGAGERFSEGSHPAQLLLLPFCSLEHRSGCAELAGLTSVTHTERAQGQACPSGQAVRLSLAVANLQAGGLQLYLCIPLRGEKSTLAAAGQVCTPGGLPKTPGDMGSLQGVVLTSF